MLNSIRKGAGSVLLKVLLGLLILSFAMWGIGDVFVFRGSKSTLAEVGSHKIIEDDFLKAYADNLDKLSQQIGKKLTTEEGKNLGLVSRTLSLLISNATFYEASEFFDLSISDELLRKEIFSAPAFKDAGGEFNRFAFERYLTVTGQNEEAALASIRQDLAKQPKM